MVEASGLTTVAGLFKLIYYFMIMLLGAYFRLYEKGNDKYRSNVYIGLAIIAVVVMYVSKYLMEKSEVMMHFQFVNQLCTVLFACFAVLACMKSEQKIKQTSTQKWYKVIVFISSITLECYLTQFLVIERAAGLQIIFPLNIVVATLAVFIFARILKFITDPIYKLIKM
ncbi:hypothetical protein SDC9_127952 [bioreactor metagenome]|uniref:Uncharacterized protein n=1 Tax=bioreactor metagenome TaxID=1076179 RepID=A0A645CVG4_9ZZZZ